ncbi:MAG: DEDD exonuclease domain-containing protein [Actinobacteria bacterium]|nr:DEDD exonuclease domain-containing protein [Actinomycetota bacterium]
MPVSARKTTRETTRAPPLQRSLDDLGTPLSDVTFCVIDLETTGTSPATCAITEIGAVKLRGGACLGTFQTLVDPGCGIPPRITVLTGITEAMVHDAPLIDAVLPTLLEFVGDSVIVGHNVRFDLSFLRAALERADRPPLTNRSVDTCALARRLVRDQVPDCKLGTLARHLRLDHSPNHRALDDALATGELLHLLIERAATLGVTGLDDLLVLPTMAGHAEAGKLPLTETLPRLPGVYIFRDRRGDVLYVGKATNLRSRVRSYFSTDGRRKVQRLLRETQRIDHQVCSSPLEAAVIEIRLIHRHQPRYNRQGTGSGRYVYLKLTLGEAFPRLAVARVVRDDGALYIGPVRSTSFARQVIGAIHSVVPLRRCTGRVPRDRSTSSSTSPCTAAQLGAAACPCSGSIDESDYADIADLAYRGLTGEPQLLLRPLAERMQGLAAAERFEEAADARNGAEALASTLLRQRRIDILRNAGRVRVRIVGHGIAEVINGRLHRTWSDGEPDPVDEPTFDEVAPPVGPVTRDEADELNCVATWFEREAHRLEPLHVEGPLAEPLRPIPRFAPRSPAT